MYTTIIIVALICVLAILLLARTRQNKNRSSDWVLVWSDEFDGAAGSPPDRTKWTCEVGGSGFGNNELQTYTARPENVCHDGRGNLVITARKETLTGPDGLKRDYTSGRLNTLGKFAHKYGLFEGRIKIPEGAGIWPAFWMMGNDIAEIGWAGCGEQDVMEVVKDFSICHGTVHGPLYSGADGIGGAYKLLPEGQKLSDDFHVYAVEWEPSAIHFFVDGNHYFSVRTADLKGKKWVYDHPFFILLNVAVGGNWPGSPDETTVFPQTMLVDYVRVSKRRDMV
jgi:beta-glucanase (GH16 family)